VKHFNRDVLARLLGLPPEGILLVEGPALGERGEGVTTLALTPPRVRALLR
jgi:hypothetical protein